MTTPTPDNAASATKGIVATVCLVPHLSDHFAGVEMQLYGSYEPRIGDEYYSAATVTALEAEVRELRADAMRYRWVKDRSLNKTVMDSRQQNGPFFAYGSILSGWHTPNDIDGAIDAHITGAGAK